MERQPYAAARRNFRDSSWNGFSQNCRALAVNCFWLCCLLWPVAVLPAEDRLDKLAGGNVIPFSQNGGPSGKRLSVETVAEGDSSRQQRKQAVAQLPMSQLNSAAQASVQDVLDSLSLYRRLPTTQVEVDHRVYGFFAEHPDAAVSIWRAMQISRVQLNQVGPTEFETDTRDGTRGKVSVLFRSPTSQLVYCDGQFQSPALTKPIRARALMHLQSTLEEAAPGSPIVTHSCDLFVSFPSQAVETVAKVISPLSNRIADRNFEEISLFLEMMQTMMSRQPGWVESITGRMDGVAPQKKDNLLQLTAAVYVDAQRQSLERSGAPVTVDGIRPPIRTASQND